MAKTRRAFIKIVGSSAVIVAAGGGYFAATRTPTKALEPWSLAGTGYSDPRMRAISYAILAPNPHNRQPWMVDLAIPGEATLYCDLERLLPETDPPNRQITIGFGCFLELLRMAAAEEGMRAEITRFPEGVPDGLLDERPIAHIKFHQNGATRDPLFAHVLDRRSVKEVYDTAQPVADDALAQIASAAANDVHIRTTNDMSNVEKFRDLTWRAHVVETMTPHTMQESIDLMRIGKKEINENPDGIELGGVFLETLALTGQISREQLADQNSRAFKIGLDMFEEIMMSGMAYTWVITDTNTRDDQLNAGQAWVRMNLQATQLGLGFHPHSQALQEFPEMSALFAEIHNELGVSGEGRVQMFGRLGYGPTQQPTPRWRAETRVTGL
jgi:hypothetical protein